ncbi:MAG: YncE family protein [Limisphaerales bacterium]
MRHSLIPPAHERTPAPGARRTPIPRFAAPGVESVPRTIHCGKSVTRGRAWFRCWSVSSAHLLLTAALWLIAPMQAAETPRAVQTGPGHRFACADYSQGKVFIVSADARVEWEYDAPNANDLWVLPNGNLLFNTGHGVREVTREKKVIFDYQSSSEIYACQRLADGNTFIGECNAGRLLHVDPTGRVVKELRLLPAGQDGGHAYMRNARHLADGHYLVAHYGDHVVREYDANGKTVREIPAPGGPHSAIRLPDGNTLIACGDGPGGSRVFEADAAGRTVWEVNRDDLPGISLKFMAGLHRLPNGNTVMSNWLGHGQFGQAPHLIEITREKRVTWTFADHQTMRTISSVQVLDDLSLDRPLH